MNGLILKGLTKVDGMQFHDIEGGFGEGKKTMLVKDIAEIHSRELKEINRRINDNRKRFIDGVDIIDLKTEQFAVFLKHSGIFTQNSINAANNIYLLSERGYAKLLKILEDDLAWELYDKLVDNYFNLRAEVKETYENLSPTLQLFSQMFKAVAQQDARLNQIETSVTATNQRLDNMGEIISLDPNDWRNQGKRLIVKIAQAMGGYEFIKEVNNTIYDLLDKRFGVSLETRLTNKRRRMSEEGVCKSKRDKTNKVDIIAEDKKLIGGYIAIIKEMAIKYGVNLAS